MRLRSGSISLPRKPVWFMIPPKASAVMISQPCSACLRPAAAEQFVHRCTAGVGDESGRRRVPDTFEHGHHERGTQ